MRLFILLLIPFLAFQMPEKTPVDYVNPFIGTGGHGHTYPGATLPFGMVQLSPDTRLTGWDGCSGYHFTDSIVFGFSHTHLSGTGVPDYGDLLLMPTTGDLRLNNGADGQKGYRSHFSHANEKARPGSYSTLLDDYGIAVNLTATAHAGLHQYAFPANAKTGNLVIDLKHRDKVINCDLKVVSETEVEGFRISNAWAHEQHFYFVARFSQPLTKEKEIKDDGGLVAGFSCKLKKGKPLLVKVGISAVSIDGARRNLDAEIPQWDFDNIRNSAEAAWLKELGKVEIKGGTDDQKTVFYTALYHTMVVPNLFQDVDGQYRGMDLKIHEAKNFTNYSVFSLWDTYRGANPLYTILEPQRVNDFVNTFLQHYETGGFLPVWELAGNETFCMIGNHSIPVIADAWMKGIRGYDVPKALKAMEKSVMQEKLGYGAYRKFGFIPAEEESESVSKTLEYAFDDYCLGKMLEANGNTGKASYFIGRSGNYRNVLDPATGFMRAKLNGAWTGPFDPSEVNNFYTEANSWQYSFYVPQDIAGLRDALGGKQAMEKRLDQLFAASSQTTGRDQADITGLIGQYAHGNEPSHHIAYLYNYVGKPWKTQQMVRKIVNELYRNDPDGLCGNEDCGQMSAWYVLSAMGFYPVVPCGGTYNIGSPLFPEVILHLDNGKTFAIRADNSAASNPYIQSATLNGAIWNHSYLQHSDLLKGGELVFKMGPNPAESWGNQDDPKPEPEIHAQPAVPYIVSGDRTFTTTTRVALGSPDTSAEIYYRLAPTEDFMYYTGPFTLNGSTYLTFYSTVYKKDKDGHLILGGPNNAPQAVTSMFQQATFYKIPVGRNIKLLTAYANQYNAGGDNALIDFIRGSRDFRLGAWQGYEGVNIEAVVDLGKVSSVSRMLLSCLQDQGAWIFMPDLVRFEISDDGKTFKEIGGVMNDVPEKAAGPILKEFVLHYSTNTRYIKVTAVNKGKIPNWHPGAGGKPWIFADEIVVE